MSQFDIRIARVTRTHHITRTGENTGAPVTPFVRATPTTNMKLDIAQTTGEVLMRTAQRTRRIIVPQT